MTPPRHRPQARIAATTAVLAALATLLAGCTNNSDDDNPAGAASTSTTGAGTSTPPDYDAGTTPPPPASTPYLPQASSRPPEVLPTRTPTLPTATPGRPGRPRGLSRTSTQVDRTSPLAVALAFAELLTASDTRIDNQTADAGRRASRLATPALARQLLGPPPAGNPGAAWRELQRHHGYTTATTSDATEAGAPADTSTNAHKAIAVRSTPTDGKWLGPPTDLVLYIHLTRSSPSSPWSVADYSIQ